MELIQISLTYFCFYEKCIFSVNRKQIFYGLTTKYVTKLLHWKYFQQITVRIQKKANKVEKPLLTSWSVYSEFLSRLSRVTSRPRVCLHLFPPCVLLLNSYSLVAPVQNHFPTSSTLFISYLLHLRLCITSYLEWLSYPCASVWEKTLARVPNFL